MAFSFSCIRINIAFALLALSSHCKFIQSPMDLGPLEFHQPGSSASCDFGKIFFDAPAAVLRPQSTKEISQLLIFLQDSFLGKVTVAARGAGHSTNGQAQALNGIVIEMESLPNSIKIHRKADGASEFSHADVGGGTLWVELLQETLKEGLAPRSWTDYLYLSVGGTLSNGGISGQTFKYGPQISNVLQLEVITGKGEMVTCSPTHSSELFYAVLGGLGQFGIITSARILLQDAPKKVKWIRAMYDDFQTFVEDQELLILMADEVDYVEGFIIVNEQSLHSTFATFPSHQDSFPDLYFGSSDIYYCIEFAVHYSFHGQSTTDDVVEMISRKLRFMPSLIYIAEVSYFDFLNRVRMEEMSLRSIGLWDVPHPWLNMLVPSSTITQFKDLLLDHLSPSTYEGPILTYPFLRDKWNSNASAVLPEASGGDTGDEVVFLVGVLRSANPATCSTECLKDLLLQNHQIVAAATQPRIGAKQYLPHFTQQHRWKDHFGQNWDRFAARKTQFDPLHILAPAQGVFNQIHRHHSAQ